MNFSLEHFFFVSQTVVSKGSIPFLIPHLVRILPYPLVYVTESVVFLVNFEVLIFIFSLQTLSTSKISYRGHSEYLQLVKVVMPIFWL